MSIYKARSVTKVPAVCTVNPYPRCGWALRSPPQGGPGGQKQGGSKHLAQGSWSPKAAALHLVSFGLGTSSGFTACHGHAHLCEIHRAGGGRFESIDLSLADLCTTEQRSPARSSRASDARPPFTHHSGSSVALALCKSGLRAVSARALWR